LQPPNPGGSGLAPEEPLPRRPGAVTQPDVYLALGISDQVQHTVGVNGATTIVAINEAKSVTDLQPLRPSLVGDLSAVLPSLADQLP